jgi:hypothetical protein
MKIVITENQQDSLKSKIYQIIDKMGLKKAIKLVNGFDNLVKVLFGGDMTRVGEIIELPYFMSLKKLEIPSDRWKEIFGGIFNQDVEVVVTGFIYGEDGYEIYREGTDGLYDITTYYDTNITKSIEKNYLDGSSETFNYTESGDLTRWEDSDGQWQIRKYDKNRRLISREDSDGSWIRREFDENGDLIYMENHKGVWRKYGYDENGDRSSWGGSNDDTDSKQNIKESKSNLRWLRRRDFKQQMSDQEIYNLLKDIVVEGGDYTDICNYNYEGGKDDYIREIINGSIPTFIYSFDELGYSYTKDIEEFVYKLITDEFHKMISDHYENYLELCDE